MSLPIFFENSKVPIALSKISPIEIGAITLGPFIFSRGIMSDQTKNHECIHWEQYKECFIIGFLFLYATSWLINICKGMPGAKAYRAIWFEKEAYDHDMDFKYVSNRSRYGWARKACK
jgi:hypothetical protein